MTTRMQQTVAGIARQVWAVVRPDDARQRVLWWTGSLLLVSGVVHLGVAAVDGASWWGPVSWRKPVVFGLSFGLMLWAMVWVLRQLPSRRWTWLPAGLLAALSLLEVALITMQRWRGQPSHFNPCPGFDKAVWSAMGTSVIFIALSVTILFGWAAIRFRGGLRGGPEAIAVLAGLTGCWSRGTSARTWLRWARPPWTRPAGSRRRWCSVPRAARSWRTRSGCTQCRR